MKTGQAVFDRSRKDIGKRYVYGAFVPKDYPNWPGPFDCAEADSYWYYQVTGILVGTSNHQNPKTADAWTGFWKEDGENKEIAEFIPVSDAAAIPGAAVLRFGTTVLTGHIVLSDGEGGTVEAHSTNRGVIASTLSDRRWDVGVLVKGVDYKRKSAVDVVVPKYVYRLVSPMVLGKGVEAIQLSLASQGFNPGEVDGYYGPKTFGAVLEFQRAMGLLVDGEVGPQTWKALGLGEMK